MKPLRTLIILLSVLIGATGFVVLLFVLSESGMRKENPFIRRFIPMSAEISTAYKLDGYGYYFAGAYGNKIYLANHSTPLYITEIDTSLNKAVKHKIRLAKYDFPFRSAEIRVSYPYFFFYDGMVPVIFRGRVSDFSAEVVMDKKIFFTDAAVIDSTTLAIRGQKPPLGEHIAGLLGTGSGGRAELFPDFLVKQQDGIFDTDGQFAYDPGAGKVIYIYYYRNEFIAADSSMQLSFRGKTIDTVSKADLKIMTMEGSGDTRLAAPALMVNRKIAAEGGVLFVQSLLRGRHEPKKIWQKAGAIDLYDLGQGHYLSSFYVYHSGRHPLKEFTVTRTALYGILGNSIEKYNFGKPIKKHFKP